MINDNSIKNKTQNKIIAKDFKVCKSILSKAIGLMFRKNIIPMVFIFDKEKKIDLHMFFVYSAIDVLFLNRNKEVVEAKEHFKPFTIYNPKNKSKFIIELPGGTISDTKIRLGDKISF